MSTITECDNQVTVIGLLLTAPGSGACDQAVTTVDQ